MTTELIKRNERHNMWNEETYNDAKTSNKQLFFYLVDYL